jgi:hypothetical protein
MKIKEDNLEYFEEIDDEEINFEKIYRQPKKKVIQKYKPTKTRRFSKHKDKELDGRL